jgi:hypothetical protein
VGGGVGGGLEPSGRPKPKTVFLGSFVCGDEVIGVDGALGRAVLGNTIAGMPRTVLRASSFGLGAGVAGSSLEGNRLPQYTQ